MAPAPVAAGSDLLSQPVRVNEVAQRGINFLAPGEAVPLLTHEGAPREPRRQLTSLEFIGKGFGRGHGGVVKRDKSALPAGWSSV